MTLAKFDPRNITQYIDPRYLLHFQWGKSEKVYRYALVEILNPGIIDHKTKQKDDEIGLTQKEIWKKKYIKNKE
jgi:hypothetical protein